MARPKKIDLVDREWPVIRERIHRDGTSRTWQVDSNVEVGTEGRVRKSFKTRTAAEGFAGRLRLKYAREGAVAFDLTEAERIDAKTAIDTLRTGGAEQVTLASAVAYYLRHAAPKKGDITLADLVDAYIDNRRLAGLREASIERLSRRCGKFARFAGPKRLAKDIGEHDIESWLSSRNLAPQSRKNDLAEIRALFEYALAPDSYKGLQTIAKRNRRASLPIENRGGYVGTNPASRIEPPTVEQAEIVILDNAAVARLLAEAYRTRLTQPQDGRPATPDHLCLLPYVAIGLFAGIRPFEIGRLSWDAVDMETENPAITVTKAKTRLSGVRDVDIHPTLARWLAVCPTPHSGAILDTVNFPKRFQALTRQAGIERWPQDAMRHTFASALYAHRRDAGYVATQLGHSRGVDVLIKHYRKLMRPAIAAAFWDLTPEKVLSDSMADVIPFQAA